MTEFKKVTAAVDEVAQVVERIDRARGAGEYEWAMFRQYEEASGQTGGELRGRVAKLKRKADAPPEERYFGPQMVAKVHALADRFAGVARRLTALGEWVHAQHRAAAQETGGVSPMLHAEIGPGRRFVVGAGAEPAFAAAALLHRSGDDPLQWAVVLRGPLYSAYYGGEWALRVTFPGPDAAGLPAVRCDGAVLPHPCADRGTGEVRLGDAAWGEPPRLSTWLAALRRGMRRPQDCPGVPRLWLRELAAGYARWEGSVRRTVQEQRRPGAADRARLRGACRGLLLVSARRQLLPNDFASAALLPFVLPLPPPVYFVPAGPLR